MNPEASTRPGLVARWAVHTAAFDDAQQARAGLVFVRALLERLELADDDLRADVLRIMDRTLHHVAGEVPQSAAERRTDEDSPDLRRFGVWRRGARRDPKGGRRHGS